MNSYTGTKRTMKNKYVLYEFNFGKELWDKTSNLKLLDKCPKCGYEKRLLYLKSRPFTICTNCDFEIKGRVFVEVK